MPTVTPPASPARSEETVGFAPANEAAAKMTAKTTPTAPASSFDPTDISSYYRATKKRR